MDWGRNFVTCARLLAPAVLAASLILPALSLPAGPSPGLSEGQESTAPAGARQLAEEAQQAVRQGDYPRAVAAYRKLATLSPNVAEVHANLGAVCYFAKQYDDAIRECRRALELKPALKSPEYFLALSLAETGRCEDALPQLERDFPALQDPHLKRQMGVGAVRCAMALDKPQDAVRLVFALIKEFPRDPDVLYLGTHVFSDLSTHTAQQLLAAAPGSAPAHQLNAEALETEGKLPEAIEEYRKVLALNPQQPGVHFEIGRLLLVTTPGNSGIEQAEEEFKKELEIDPWSSSAEYQLGNLAWQKRDWDIAIRHFKRATELDPRMAAAWVGLGKSLGSAERFQEAVTPLQRAVQLDPQDPDAHYRLAFVWRRLGRNQEAEAELAAYRRAEQEQTDRMKKIRQGMTGAAPTSSATPPPAPPR